jgi:hypothetical protein
MYACAWHPVIAVITCLACDAIVTVMVAHTHYHNAILHVKMIVVVLTYT